MYKVKMKTLMMGPNIKVKPGEVITVDDTTGAQLIESRSAELIEVIPETIQSAKIETAMLQPPENAMVKKATARIPKKKDTVKRR